MENLPNFRVWYILKVHFCLICAKINFGGANYPLCSPACVIYTRDHIVTVLPTLLVKYYYDYLDRQSSGWGMGGVTLLYVGGVFVIPLGSKYANFQQKITSDTSCGKSQTFHCSNFTSKYTRFGYYDFRQYFLILCRISAILSKILCRIQIWVRKNQLSLGQKLYALGGDRTHDLWDSPVSLKFLV